MELLQTNRIELRHWEAADAPELYRYASDPDIGYRAGWKPHTTIEESREIIATVFDTPTTWAIVLKSTGQVVGAIGYGVSCECDIPSRAGEPTVGYWVAKPYWGRGICTEALALVIKCVAEHTTIASLVSGHFVDNPASGRVMEKCGFEATGEICESPSLYGGAGRPIRVLRKVIVR